MPAYLGADREQITADGTRYAFIPSVGWMEVYTADELLATLAQEPVTPNTNAASASPSGRGLFSGYLGPVPAPETDEAPEGARLHEQLRRLRKRSVSSHLEITTI